MLLRSSILTSVAVIALAGFAQAAGQTAPTDMPSSQTPTTTPAPTPQADTVAPSQGVKLSEVQNPKATLRGAAVKDAKGEAIGEVKSVQLDPSGKVAAVSVSMGGKTIALKADTLSYAQADHTLISTQTKAEIGTP